MLAVGVAALWIAALAVKGVLRPGWECSGPTLVGVVLDSAPSFVGGLTVPWCLLILHPSPSRSAVTGAGAWALGILAFAELLELGLRHSTFDWRDLAASVLGVAGGVAVGLGLLRCGAARSAERA